MKAVVVNHEGTGVEIIDQVIRPIKMGEALVYVEYCGVCHTDLHVAHGDFGKVPKHIQRHMMIDFKSAHKNYKKVLVFLL